MDARAILCSWNLFVMDYNNKPIVLIFDSIEGSLPVIVGLDILQYAKIDNTQHKLSCRCSTDTSERTFSTYIAKDHGHDHRARMFLLPRYNISSSSILGTTLHSEEAHISKELHRVRHATKQEIKDLLRDAGIDNKKIFDRYNAVFDSCDICATPGRPHQKVKMPLKHVNEAFNEFLQVDYTVAYIEDEKYEILIMVDTRTAYGERYIAPSRSADHMNRMFDIMWLCRHGALK